MPTSYTTNLGLALPVTAELAGTWGDVVNNEITSLLDSAVAGTTTLSSDADVTLTTTTGAANQSRQAILLWTANGTATRTITAPARTKAYVVINATAGTQSIKLVGAGPTTGITIVAGEKCLAAWNGSDFVKVASTVVAASQITGTLGTANGGTGLTSFTANGVVYASSTSALTTGSALTFDGTNFGVGTTVLSAGKISELVDLSAANGFVIRDSASTYGNTNNYLLLQNSAGSTAGGLTHPADQSLGIWGYTDLRFLQGSGATEAMRLTSTGLGIGTSSPQAKMHVVGQVLGTTQFISSGTGVNAFCLNSAGSYYGTIQNDSADRWSLGYNATANGLGTSVLTWNSSGNLGLGVPPSAWTGSGAQVLEFGSKGNALLGNVNVVDVTYNAYFDSAWKYGINGFASYYAQSGGAHKWYTAPSGTAGDPISFTQAMTLDASGNLGIGTTSPGARLHVSGGDIRLANNQGMTFRNVTNTASASFILQTDDNFVFYNPAGTPIWSATSAASPSATYGANVNNRVEVDASGNYIAFKTNGTEVARFSSTGDLGLGTTVSSSRRLNIKASSGGGGNVSLRNTSDTEVGSIVTDATTTTYNTTSDIRLKENITAANDAAPLIDALQVRQFDWKADGSHQRYGFVAQELDEVYPEAVSKPADPEEMMGVDYSKLVPLLVKEIQSLRARVAQLETAGV